MKAIAVNGSPRKSANTATLLQHALEGAAGQGAETELVHLYDLDYTGCISCFACKQIGGKSYGRCAVKDELEPLLQRIAEADVLLLGTPVYFGAETGELRSFIERLLFPYLTYTPDFASIFPGKLQTGLVYTMNAPEDELIARNYDRVFAGTRNFVTRTLGNCELLLATDTYQFGDYAKYFCPRFDPEAKKQRRDEVFPVDCRKAHALGAKLAAAAKTA